MSFSSDIKEKLSTEYRKKEKVAEAYVLGLIGFGAELRAESVRFNTENKYVADSIMLDLRMYLNIQSECESVRGYRLSVTRDKDKLMKRIAEVADSSMDENISSYIPDESCAKGFITGAFMTGGSVSDPQKSYHIEFDTRYKEFSDILCTVLKDLGINAKVSVRKSHFIVYVKEYESIAKILSIMGAGSAALELYAVQVEKEMRNDINRRINFETANVNKITKAAAKQKWAIDKIMSNGAFETLPEGLKEIALIRMEHPDYSLKQLGENMRPKLGKSGVNHRLGKLIEIAEDL